MGGMEGRDWILEVQVVRVSKEREGVAAAGIGNLVRRPRGTCDLQMTARADGNKREVKEGRNGRAERYKLCTGGRGGAERTPDPKQQFFLCFLV